MVMIMHDCISDCIDRKDLTQRKNFIFNPLPSMLIGLTRNRIIATEKGSTNTTRDTVVIGGGIKGYQRFPCSRHGAVLAVVQLV
jgi:hypothetical protein